MIVNHDKHTVSWDIKDGPTEFKRQDGWDTILRGHRHEVTGRMRGLIPVSVMLTKRKGEN